MTVGHNREPIPCHSRLGLGAQGTTY